MDAPNRRYARTIIVVLALAAASCSDATVPDPATRDVQRGADRWLAGDGSEPFKVYTQNAYVGGDTGPVLTLDFDDVPDVVAKATAFWADVQASDVPERAASIVDRIDERRPHLVTLQEVFYFDVLDLSTGSPQVTQVVDILADIQAEIAGRGLPYDVVAVQGNTAVGFPFDPNLPGLPLTLPPTRFLRLQDRVAMLRRTDVEVSAVAQGNYAATFSVGPITLRRGWIRATTELDGTAHHVVGTHLEGQALAPIQALQAEQLLDQIAAGLPDVTILAGDFNSDAAADPSAPSWTATYGAIVAAGYDDAWLASGGSSKDPGYTCCQDPDLRNGTSTLDERIDFVFVRDARTPQGETSGSVHVEIVGDEQADRTLTNGLWPADHAGLVAGLRLPWGLSVGGG
ncbi:MAG TPA: endonuclease/exonuclease/phosphatase family protein [Longimicrobiales bacterium]|nr:endonuclease/exonuclease/phosphatase family protein [Longimicrobiales bacterium]